MLGDVLWAVVGAAVVTCEVVARWFRQSWPTIGQLARWLRARPVGWTLLILAWLWLGWHVFAR